MFKFHQSEDAAMSTHVWCVRERESWKARYLMEGGKEETPSPSPLIDGLSFN